MEKQNLEIVYSNSMKINRGNYEQEAPFYSAKVVIEDFDGKDVESRCNSEYARLQGIIEPLLAADYNKKRTDLANVRIREKDGKQYPSVTSILCPDGIYKGIKNLAQFTERGKQLDKIFKTYITTGKLLRPNPLKFDPLPWEFDVEKFCEENGLKPSINWKADIEVYNEEWMYSGEIDLLYKNANPYDVKAGNWKWEQAVAYSKARELPTAGIFDIKEGKLHEITMDSPEAKKAWENFLVKRGEFKARFGI